LKALIIIKYLKKLLFKKRVQLIVTYKYVMSRSVYDVSSVGCVYRYLCAISVSTLLRFLLDHNMSLQLAVRVKCLVGVKGRLVGLALALRITSMLSQCFAITACQRQYR